MKKVIIFGKEDFASLAHFYLREDSDYEVAGFAVSGDYLVGEDSFEGLPLAAFEDVEQRWNPEEYDFFAPISHRKMNAIRTRFFAEIEAKGYQMISYVSSKVTTFSNVKVGKNCFILEDNTLQPFVTIGDNVVLWSGNHIGHHSTIDDGTFITSHVVVSGHCKIGRQCFIGVNATLRDGITLGDRTFVAMGSLVNGDTEADGVYKGQPATKSRVPSFKVC